MISISDSMVYQLCFETTKLLSNNQQKLKNIKWTNGEANIDTEYSTLACECCIAAWDIIKRRYPEYAEIQITCVIPDINIVFTHPDQSKQYFKIELKSSKRKSMPGSTINKLDINQPLIYCMRPTTPESTYEFRYSQYHSAMGESNLDLFQDRTPRPVINFEKMKNTLEDSETLVYELKDKNGWIEHYAHCGLNRISDTSSCQTSWQDEMIKIMKKKIIEDYIKNTSCDEFHMQKMSLQIEHLTL